MVVTGSRNFGTRSNFKNCHELAEHLAPAGKNFTLTGPSVLEHQQCLYGEARTSYFSFDLKSINEAYLLSTGNDGGALLNTSISL